MKTLPNNPFPKITINKLKSTLFKFNYFIKPQRFLTKTMAGQALPIVFITLAVITVGILYATSKTIVDVETTSLEEEALRAFSAAEAGVEEALLAQEPVSGTLPGTGTSFDTTFTVPEASDSFVHPDSIVSGEIATFWFTERTPGGEFTCDGGSCYEGPKLNNVCWGIKDLAEYDTDKIPAIELIVYYDTTGGAIDSPNDYSNVEVSRTVYDPNHTRALTNNFNEADISPCTIENVNFSFEKNNIGFNPSKFPGMPGAGSCSQIPGCILMLRIKMLYNDDSGGSPAVPDRIGIEVQSSGPDSTLSPQGNIIESIGTSGRSVRKFEVFQGHDDPPSVFENAVFSYEDLTK